MRCFISIDIPEEIKDSIREIQNQLPEFFGKKTEFENLHLTLKFLGEVDENQIEEVKRRLREINFNEFKTEINELGVFDNRRSKKYSRKIIVWLHLTKCEELQKQVDEALKDLLSEEVRFMSHLTIARVKDVKEKNNFLDDLKKVKLQRMMFNVDAFRLKKSVLTADGPVYETLEEYVLDAEYFDRIEALQFSIVSVTD